MKSKTTTEMAMELISSPLFKNKLALCKELGLSRPTMDSRLSGESKWKLLEEKWIKNLYKNLNK